MYKYFSTNQYKNVIKAVTERCAYLKMDVPILTFKGTVKIHGANCSISNNLSSDELVSQSRNNIITPDLDSYGFLSFMEREKNSYKKLFSLIKQDYPEYLQTKTAVIYGEWCGGSIQKSVGLTSLDKRHVIFAIKLIDTDKKENSEIWFSEEQIKNLFSQVGSDELNKHNIYNIYDFKTWELKIDMKSPKLAQNELIEITTQVENNCPVAKFFGVDGIGEGVVWRCISEVKGLKTEDLIFKVKGKKHSVTKVKTIAEVDTVKVNNISEFIEAVLTENRLIQGLDYLRENNLDISNKNLGIYLKWIGTDCLKEESDILENSNLERKDVMPAINRKAKEWFFTQLNRDIINENKAQLKKKF